MLFDTHAHYDDDRFENEDIIKSLPENGVSLVINAGCDLERSLAGINLATKYKHVYCSVGFHPQSADEMKDCDINELEDMASFNKVVAIGEIGLDYYYDTPSRDIQKKVFIEQMKLADKLNLPVIIHDRDAHGDCMEIIRMFPNVRGVFHCYAGSLEMARELISLGYYISFAGVVTFKNAKNAIAVIENIDIEHILIETDSPYLAPEPHRGTLNDSRNVRFVAEKIAEIKNLVYEQVVNITMQNGLTAFGITL